MLLDERDEEHESSEGLKGNHPFTYLTSVSKPITFNIYRKFNKNKSNGSTWIST